MRKRADDDGVDLLLVDTGDRVEGNGLYDASEPKGLYQYDIFAEQSIDVISVGNHELYKAYSVEREHNTTTVNFKQNYVASNLDYVDPESGERSPMAPRYRQFTTKNQGIKILAFGFLFDFTGNAKNSAVQPVADVIKEDWFQEAIRQKPDVFLIIGHVGLRMKEFETIFTAVRKQNWDTPIIFFGGHAHVRDARSYDSLSFAMASGRYLETIGWMSVDKIKTSAKEVVSSADVKPKFSRRYIDNNLFGMYHHTGLNETTFPTEHGRNVSEQIHAARQALKLDHTFGCAPRNLWMSRAEFPSDDNLYTFLQNQVFPGIIVNEERKDKSRIALMNTGGIRFDIFKGPFTRDTEFIVSPFVSGFRYVPDVPYKVAEKVITLLNKGGRIFGEGLETQFMAIPEQMFPADPSIFKLSKEREDPHLELRGMQESEDGSGEPDLINGYTTKDDIGSDGDDTVHQAIDFYAQPNCFQSEIAFPPDGEKPETVDVVFIDFIQPWIVLALKFSGGDYGDGDVKEYMSGTFTDKLTRWIQDNWDSDC
jgi:hypothetical protein